MTTKTIDREKLTGVWSAAPTPLTGELKLDAGSVDRMVEHHRRLGVNGLFLLGTNGEGPWLADSLRWELVRRVVGASRGRMLTAVQVTDNSVARMLDNARLAQEAGADIAVIASPFFLLNATPDNLLNLYLETIDRSPLPVGIYDRGKFGSVLIPDKVLKAIYGHEKVILVKDSSADPVRCELALAARRKRPRLRLLNGWEFRCDQYLEAGFDGLLLGGGVFNGYLAGLIVEAVKSGDLKSARRLQDRMNRIMWAVYGGRKIKCWLAGEKELLVRMGIFGTNKTLLGYTLTAGCAKAIERLLEKDRDVLLPYRQ